MIKIVLKIQMTDGNSLLILLFCCLAYWFSNTGHWTISMFHMNNGFAYHYLYIGFCINNKLLFRTVYYRVLYFFFLFVCLLGGRDCTLSGWSVVKCKPSNSVKLYILFVCFLYSVT